MIVDYVRERKAQKRGGGEAMVTLTTGVAGENVAEDVIGPLHEALKSLEQIDARAHRVVEMRYFAGMTEEEIADLLEVSVPTVKRDWRKARALHDHAERWRDSNRATRLVQYRARRRCAGLRRRRHPSRVSAHRHRR